MSTALGLAILAQCILAALGIKDPTISCQRKVLSMNKVNIEVEGKGVSLKVFDKFDQVILDANLGLDLPEELLEPNFCQNNELCLEWGTMAKLELIEDGEFCTDVTWETSALKSLKDCFDIRNRLYTKNSFSLVLQIFFYRLVVMIRISELALLELSEFV